MPAPGEVNAKQAGFSWTSAIAAAMSCFQYGIAMSQPYPDAELAAFAAELGFGAETAWQLLGGGVSCEVWLAEAGTRRAVIKRALERLKVGEEWLAPVRRNATEWAWFETVERLLPAAVPRLIAHDPARGLFAMEFLPHPLWKAELLAGRADAAFAGDVGAALAKIHAATAGDIAIAARFARDEDFFALRLDPYLLAAARRHAGLDAAIDALVSRTAAAKLALVHGDISPKNILIGPAGPVFLDAETACYGDPAFDLAFCLNHLLLKALVRPDASAALEASFAALQTRYLAGVDWEPAGNLDARAAALLPALMLARADGKSPAEYLTEAHKVHIRRFARLHILHSPPLLAGFYGAWRRSLAGA